MDNTYLLAAFAIVWAITFVYLWILLRQQKKLKQDVEELLRRQGPKH